jgi:DNA-binding NtrC family response regulator
VDTRAPRILVVDDDPASCRLVQAAVRPSGWQVTVAPDGTAGLARAATEPLDAVVLDLGLPDVSGLEVLQALLERDRDLPVVMLTGHADLKTAVAATRLGAFDYLTKPVEPDELTHTLERAIETRALKREVAELRRQMDDGLAARMGGSAQVADVVERVRTVAASDFSVLVLGETGTGKELVAQAIHRQSARRDKPLVALDCGAIPEALLESELFGHEKGAFTGAGTKRQGRFQLAQGGTLFLDEVGNLPLALQSKLLRVLEAREVQPVGGRHPTPLDVRFVAATNDDLQARAVDGRFRVDLYFRLAQYTISLPPLRARAEDIPYLVARFVAEASLELRRPVSGVAPEAMAVLGQHRWSGNVRELRNVIRRAVLESDQPEIKKALVARVLGHTAARATATEQAPVAGRTLKEVAAAAARDAERQLITATLRATGGNKSRAARELETDYKTLHLKMKALGIRARDFMP